MTNSQNYGIDDGNGNQITTVTATLYGVMQMGDLGPERYTTRAAAQAEADRLNAEADEETRQEVWGDGAAAVVELAS